MRVTFIVEGDQGFTRTMNIDERAAFNYDEFVLELLGWKAGRALVVGEAADCSRIMRLSVTEKGADTFRVSREFILGYHRSTTTLNYHRQSPFIVYTNPTMGEYGYGKEFLLPVRVIGEAVGTDYLVVEAGIPPDIYSDGTFLPRVVVSREDLLPCNPE